MPRSDRPTFRRALLLGGALVLATLSCGRDVTGLPGSQLMRGFTFDARFDTPGLANGVAGEIVSFDRVRVVLVNAAGDTVVDRVVSFPSDRDSVQVAFDVPVATDAPANGEPMDVALRFMNTANDTVFRGGPFPVRVVPSLPGQAPPAPPVIPVTYVGVGANAVSIVVTPASDTVLAGDPFTFSATALDAQASPIANTPIAWRSESPTIATITAPGVGVGIALPSRGPAMIIAQLLTGPADTVLLHVLPRAQALVTVSGNNQTATLGAPLAQPLVVRVNATDGQGMAGITVNFAVTAGGGSVSAPSVVTDANGLAQVSWTAGAGLGAQTVSATAAGLTGSPLTFTALAPLTELLHHYPMAGDVSDVAGGVSGALLGTAVVSGNVLVLDGAGYVQFPSYLVPTEGSFSVSLFVRNRTPEGLAEYLSQGITGGPGFFLGQSIAGQLRAGDGWLTTGVPAPATDALFHHIVFVSDSAANASRLYVDGTLRATLPQRTLVGATGSFTRLGRQFDVLNEYLTGDLDEVRVVRGVLSAAQVTGLHAAGVTAPGRIVFGAQPTNTTAGAAIAPAVVVRAEDALGRVKTDYTGPVTIALTGSPAGVTLGGTLTVNAVAGIATFANLTVDVTGAAYRLTATASGIGSANSATFDVLPGAATTLQFTQQPTGAAPNTAFVPALSVTARDGQGNVATSFSGTVTVALGTNPTGAALGGTLSVTAVAGVATFSDVRVTLVGAGYTLTAAAAGLTGATSSAFTISSGVATRLDVTQQPTTAVAGLPLTPAVVVTARDAGGNIATGFTGEVTVGIWTGVGTLNGTVAANAVAGVATFANLSLTATNAALTLRANATGLTPDTTDNISVGPGAASTLLFGVQPTTQFTGQPIVPAPTVSAIDAFGNAVPGFAGTVTIALASNPSGATLGGTLTANPIGGVATFAGLTVNLPGTGYTLGATSPGLTGATSTSFDMSAGAVVNAWAAPVDGLWSAAANWSLGRAPIATDTVLINLSGTYSVTLDANFTANVIILGGGTGSQQLLVGPRTLTLTTGLAILPTGVMSIFNASVIGGAGPIVNQGTFQTIDGTVSASLSNAGTVIARSLTNFTGPVANTGTGTFRVLGSAAGGTTQIAIANGFTNFGTIEITSIDAGYTSELYVTNGTLVNAPGGTIRILPGTGGPRRLGAALDNQGTLDALTAFALNRASSTHLNSGTINVTAGTMTVTQTGTTPSFTNTGTIAIPTGAVFTTVGGSLDLTAGLVSGFTGRLSTSGGTSVRFTTATVQPRVTFGAGTVLPDPFVIAVGDSLRILAGTFDPPSLTNNGLLLIEGNAVITTALTTGPGSMLRFRGSAFGGSQASTITNGFTNTSAIELVSIDGGYTVDVAVLNGSLVNAPGATITIGIGTGGSRSLDAQLDNQGTFNLLNAVNVNRPSAAHVNSGTIDITGGNLVFSQTGTSPSFTNTGTVSVAATRAIAFVGGLADFSAGLVSGPGLLQTSSTTTVRLQTSTVHTRILLSAGAIMPDPLVIPVGDSLRMLGGVLTPPSLTNNGLLLLEGDPVITTALTTGTGSTIRVRGSAAGGSPTATFANGFTNTAAIELTSIDGGYTVVLGVTTGTLVNAPSGTITSVVGAAGSRTLAAQLDNQGTLNLPYPLTLSRASAAHVNSGTINVSGGNLAVSQTGTTPSFTNTGTVALTAGRTMSVAGGLLDLSAGLVSGYGAFLTTAGTSTVRFVTTTVQPRITLGAGAIMPDPFVVPAGDSLRLLDGVFTPPALTNNGLLLLEGNPVITTVMTTGPASIVRARGSVVGGGSSPAFTNGFTNTSAIELTTIDGGYTVILGVTNGSLVNAPTGTITSVVGAAGSRTLAAQLDNQGTIDLPYPLTLNRASAAHLNSGTINVSGGNLAISQTGTTPSFTNSGTIALSAARTLTVAGGLLDLRTGLVSGFGSFLTTTGTPTVRFVTTTVQPRITLGAGAIVPDPFVVPAGDSLRILGGTFSPPSLTNNGLLLLEGDPVLTTSMITGSGSTVRVRGSVVGGSPTATFTNGFTNTAALELATIDGGYTVVLGVTNGTLVNAPSGTITSVVGASGSRTLAAQIDNQGTIDLPYPLTLSRASSAHTNSGTINVSGGNLAVTQTGTTPSFTNTGLVALTAGRTMSVAGGLLDLSAGLVSGYSGSLTTTGTPTVRFVTTTVQPRITLGAGAIVPDPFVVPVGDSLRLLGGVFAPPSLTNNGLLLLEGDPVLTTAMTTGPASILRVRGSVTGGSPTATFTNGFTNTSAIELTTIDGGYTVVLGVTNGSLVNAPSGTITSAVGAAGSRTLAAQLDNQGTIDLPYPLTLNRASAAHLNSGTINVSGGNLAVTQTGTTPSFTNTGTVALTAARTMSVAGGLLDLRSGLVSGFGSFLTTTGTPTVRFFTTTVQPRITLGAGAIVPDPFVVPVGDSLRLLGGTFAPPSLTNDGLVLLEGDPTLTTAFTTGTGSTLRVRGSAAGGSPTATFVNGFTNTALIDLTTIDGGYTVVFGVTNGTLVNAPSGTITFSSGAAGSRTLAAQLDNQGVVDATIAFTLARANSAHVNSGTITALGTVTVTQTGVTPSFTNQAGGVVALATGQTMFVGGGTGDFRAGLVSGFNSTLRTTGTTTMRFNAPNVQPRIYFTAATTVPDAFTIGPSDSVRVVDGTFAPASLVNEGLLTFEGASVLTTPSFTTVPGSSIIVRGSPVAGTTAATITNGFTNLASLALTAEGASYGATLSIPNGTLVNAPTGTITSLAAAGGARTLSAQFDNQGTITIAAATAMTRASSTSLNAGTINLTGADLTVTQSGTTPSFTNTGTIATNGRTLIVSGGTLDLTAGLVSGYDGFLSATGTPTVRFSTATVQPRITFSATAVLPDPIVIPVGDSLRIRGGTLAPPSITVNGTLVLEGSVSVPTAIQANAGALTLVRSTTAGGGSSIVTLTSPMINAGTLRMIALDAGYGVTLNLGANTLTNVAGGTIDLAVGAGGSRTFTAGLIENLGALTVNYNTAMNAPVNQRGTMTVAATRSLTLNGLLTLFAGSTTTSAGTLTTAGGCSNQGGAFTGFACP